MWKYRFRFSESAVESEIFRLWQVPRWCPATAPQATLWAAGPGRLGTRAEGRGREATPVWKSAGSQALRQPQPSLVLLMLGQQFALWPHFSYGSKKDCGFISVFIFLFASKLWWFQDSYMLDRKLCISTQVALKCTSANRYNNVVKCKIRGINNITGKITVKFCRKHNSCISKN